MLHTQLVVDRFKAVNVEKGHGIALLFARVVNLIDEFVEAGAVPYARYPVRSGIAAENGEVTVQQRPGKTVPDNIVGLEEEIKARPGSDKNGKKGNHIELISLYEFCRYDQIYRAKDNGAVTEDKGDDKLSAFYEQIPGGDGEAKAVRQIKEQENQNRRDHSNNNPYKDLCPVDILVDHIIDVKDRHVVAEVLKNKIQTVGNVENDMDCPSVHAIEKRIGGTEDDIGKNDCQGYKEDPPLKVIRVGAGDKIEENQRQDKPGTDQGINYWNGKRIIHDPV
jgi:hypothetical protein